MTKSSVTRRKFLQSSGLAAGAAAMALTPHVLGQDAPRKLGFAIVGLGNFGAKQLLRSLPECKFAKPAALVSGDPAKAKKLAEQYGVSEKSIYNYENFDSIKDNMDVDVAYVVLPNSMHAEYTIRAAKAGKHVLCEKPMANTVEECQQMIDACKAANRKLMIGYRLRYEPYNQKAIQLCREKTYGPVKLINAEFGFPIGPNQWRLSKTLAGGGPMPDVGVYCLNATRYLTGEEPVQVSATLHQPKDDPRFKEVEESMTWWMRFPSGVLAHCATSYGVSLGARYMATTPSAQIHVEPAFGYGGMGMSVRAGGKNEKIELEQINQFAAEMDHFAGCILQDKTPLTPGEEGLADVKVMRKLYESAETGKVLDVA